MSTKTKKGSKKGNEEANDNTDHEKETMASINSNNMVVGLSVFATNETNVGTITRKIDQRK